MNYQICPIDFIGLKKLTSADLDRKMTSHITHIGLKNGSFSYMESNTQKDALLIHDYLIYRLPMYFGRIKNQDGTVRSPKIRLGGFRGPVSITKKIREIANNSPSNYRWYLAYFTIYPQTPTFVLFDDQSQIFNDFSERRIFDPDCYDLDVVENTKITPIDARYGFYTNYLSNILNMSNYCE